MKAGVIVCSDRSYKGEREDRSGPVIAEKLRDAGFEIYTNIVPDDRNAIAAELIKCCDAVSCDLVITSGGTGLSARDVTPEATLEILDREVRGISEAIRIKSLEYTPNAMLSRGVSGVRGRSLIVNLPGSPKAAEEAMDIIIKPVLHGLGVIAGSVTDCGRT